VLAVLVGKGDVVESGQVICIIEAMKMENEVRAHQAGTVAELAVAVGMSVTSGQVICRLDPA
jgi:acetyl-CoA/propionyl-CoA carboxylase biotin carboxyl carrier protein